MKLFQDLIKDEAKSLIWKKSTSEFGIEVRTAKWEKYTLRLFFMGTTVEFDVRVGKKVVIENNYHGIYCDEFEDAAIAALVFAMAHKLATK